MATVSFRAAGEADLPAIVALLAVDSLGGVPEDPTLPLDPRYGAAFTAIRADPNQLLAVADAGGRVVGCLQLTFIPGLTRRGAWRGLIEGVRVAAEMRNQGVGQAMMAWAIAQCRERGCKLVQLTTNRHRADAQRFYVRLGFAPSHVGMKLVLD